MSRLSSTRFISRLLLLLFSPRALWISRRIVCRFAGDSACPSGRFATRVGCEMEESPRNGQYILRPLARHGILRASLSYFNQSIPLQSTSIFLLSNRRLPLPSLRSPWKRARALSAASALPSLVPLLGVRSIGGNAARKAEEEFIAGDMCDATREMHACPRAAHMYTRASRVRPCMRAPRTRSAVFQRND